MTDEIKKDDELPPGDFEGDGDFDDFESAGSGTLGDLWRRNPLVKIGIVVGGLALIMTAIVLFGGKKEPVAASRVRAAPDVKQTPGTDEVSPQYAQALQDKNAEMTEEAIKKNQSSIPVPISASKEAIGIPGDQAVSEDPLARWRRIQEERVTREVVKKPEAPKTDPNAEVVKSLADAMAKQMGSILKNQEPKKPQIKQITDAEAFKKQKQDEAAAAAKAAEEARAKVDEKIKADQEKIIDILQPAGEIVYAQLINQANSDAPGPVLAEIASGPLAGSRVLGSFKASDENMVLTFDTVIVDGVSYPMNGIALDPKTANPGLATDVDHRYMERVILPGAAAFIEGIGSAIADSGNTNVTVDGGTVIQSGNDLNAKEEVFKGVEKAASKLGDVLDDQGRNKKPLITVDAGTAIGLLFVDPVTKDPAGSSGR
jgi:intracellular multiplication protein IcmE